MELITLLESALGSSERKSHGNYRFKCPLPGCTSIRKRLEIQIETNDSGHNPWKCWVCNRGGGTIKSLFRQASVDQDKIDILKTIVKVTKSWDKKNDVLVDILNLPEEYQTFDDIKKYDVVGRQARAYLHKRGITDEIILKYSIGYCETGRYANCVIIPSFDSAGILNYFAGRSFIEDDPIQKRNPEHPRRLIIPFELYINWEAPVILCEGFFDAIAIARNAVPLLEKGITEGIMKKLMLSSVQKVYIVLDKDGIREALDHAEMLIANGKKIFLIELPDKDPSAMGFEAFTRMIHNAKATSRDQLLMKKMKYKLR